MENELTVQTEDKKPSLTGFAIVAAILTSLVAITILSKKHTPYLWVSLTASLVPLPICLFFKKELALVAVWIDIVVLVGLLAAAIMFGM